MKKLLSLLLILVLVTSAVAANVTYDGDAKEFVFAPGSKYSPTDLFTNFKDVMPGDVITQKITLRHDSSAETEAKIYMRSRGAHPDSGKFLSQLKLQVNVLNEKESSSLFDNAANEAKPLEDWVLLGTLLPGTEVDLDVILTVPVELDNTYSDMIGYLDWQFMVEEIPIEEIVKPDEGEDDKPGDGEGDKPGDGEGDKPGDGEGDKPGDGEGDKPGDGEGDKPGDGEGDKPSDGKGDKPGDGEGDKPSDGEGDKPSKDAGGQYPSKDAGGQSPFTGDNAQLWLWVSVMVLAAALLLILLFKKKKSDSDEGNE